MAPTLELTRLTTEAIRGDGQQVDAALAVLERALRAVHSTPPVDPARLSEAERAALFVLLVDALRPIGTAADSIGYLRLQLAERFEWFATMAELHQVAIARPAPSGPSAVN